MKLDENTILYDSACPMCAMYTKAFVHAGLLDDEGRMAYDKRSAEVNRLIDADKARHEIALVDLKHQKVYYGIDSLYRILFEGLPFLRPFLNNRLVEGVLRLLYRFISYNRRVIAGGSSFAESCAPDFHLMWRSVYLIFATAFLMSITMTQDLMNFPAYYTPILLLGVLVTQTVLTLPLGYVKALDHAGHLVTVMLIGGLLNLIVASFVPAGYGWLLIPLVFYLYHLRLQALELSQGYLLGLFTSVIIALIFMHIVI